MENFGKKTTVFPVDMADLGNTAWADMARSGSTGLNDKV